MGLIFETIFIIHFFKIYFNEILRDYINVNYFELNINIDNFMVIYIL